ncbi:MAG: hypothetical protein OEY49_16135 [Candidatus Heimdallarchaeota archaeon]|nr:hypothetical protein [Candidatus Heimdallarchaeota archaeon]
MTEELEYYDEDDLKDSRLSFRITPKLSEEIDSLVGKHDQIRDRSEFGTKAIQFFIEYLRNSTTDEQLIMKGILSLASDKNIKSKELTQLSELYEDLYN